MRMAASRVTFAALFSLTIAVALGAVMMRRGVLAGLVDSPALARIQPMIEIAVGVLVAIIAGRIAVAAL